MKAILIVIIIILANVNLFAQKEYICTISEQKEANLPIEVCEHFNFSNRSYSFKDNEEAYRIIENLMTLSGLPMNFMVSECSGINNAFATIKDGIQFIIYDNDFLESMDSNLKKIESITVLAHEIGHHLSGHTSRLNFIDKFCKTRKESFNRDKCLKYLKQNRNQELEADRFAGYIMFKYGAPLSNIQNAYRQFSTNRDDTYSTHPKLDKRLVSVSQGFELAQSQKENRNFALEQIKGGTIDFKINGIGKAKRNKLLSKVEQYAIWKASNLTSNNLSVKSTVEGVEKKDIINNKTEYYRPLTVQQTLVSNNAIQFNPKIAFQVKNGILKILRFEKGATTTVYSNTFSEKNINFKEIQSIFTELYADGIKDRLKTN